MTVIFHDSFPTTAAPFGLAKGRGVDTTNRRLDDGLDAAPQATLHLNAMTTQGR